jgi:hypothetical protein
MRSLAQCTCVQVTNALIEILRTWPSWTVNRHPGTFVEPGRNFRKADNPSIRMEAYSFYFYRNADKTCVTDHAVIFQHKTGKRCRPRYSPHPRRASRANDSTEPGLPSRQRRGSTQQRRFRVEQAAALRGTRQRRQPICR